MQGKYKREDKTIPWRQNNECFYDFIFQNFLDWPCTSVQWGPMLHQNSESSQHRVFFSCRTDGVFSPQERTWTNTPNYIVMATVEIPNEDHYFINDLKALFNHDSAKKHPNLKIKQIITHPGEVAAIRTSPANRKVLASKSDNNQVYIWTSQKYKTGPINNFPNTPDNILLTTKSEKLNYALRFAPSLPRVISASGNVMQLFDLEGGPIKRQLGSVLPANLIKPMTTLTGHNKVEDICFKSNEICLSGGQDKEIGIWDLRTAQLLTKIKDIHQHDINSLCTRGNYIISGGEEGRLNIIDDRKYEVVYQFETGRPIYSTQFNPVTDLFGVGNDCLSFYSMSNVEETKKLEPLFIHQGMRGHINEFQWNSECPNAIISTCQESEPDVPAHGGLIHIFRPIDLFFQSEEEAADNLEKAYRKLNPEEKAIYDDDEQ